MGEKEVNKVIRDQIQMVRPSNETDKKIKQVYDNFRRNLIRDLDNNRIKAEVFLGGSLAKGTLVKKDIYDIDVFVRFNGKYNDNEISDILGKILGKKAERVHGSRDYFQIKKDGLLIEIIPVLKINRPEDALNVTDLSYFHVNYVVNKIRKNKNLVDQIRLAKNFAHSQNVYGAESYIKGFSGYALELLILHYGSFLKFIKEIAEYDLRKNGSLIIDDMKFYKDRDDLMKNLNVSKRQSPIILIDPTFKERNSLSGLSKETFYKFQDACYRFMKNPSNDFFIPKKIIEDFQEYKDLKVIKVKTNKQAGDISGAKSKKFFDFFVMNLKREFDIKKSGFHYDEEKNKAYFYVAISMKNDEIKRGPPVSLKKNYQKFKKIYRVVDIKKGFAFAKIKHKMNFDEWFKKFLGDNKKIINEMSIEKIEKS